MNKRTGEAAALGCPSPLQKRRVEGGSELWEENPGLLQRVSAPALIQFDKRRPDGRRQARPAVIKVNTNIPQRSIFHGGCRGVEGGQRADY